MTFWLTGLRGIEGLVRLAWCSFVLLVLAAPGAQATGSEPLSTLRYDFKNGLGPWLTWMKSETKKTGVEFVLPGKIDPNHLGAAGPLWLLAHLPVWAQGGPEALDLRGATLTLKMRAKGFKANGARLSWWVVNQLMPVDVDPLNDWQFSNWHLFEPNMAVGLNDDWRTIKVVLDPSSSGWRYGGNNILQGDWASRYTYFPIEKTLAHVNATIHLAFVGGTQDLPPEGTIEIAEITISGARQSKPQASGIGFDFLERLLVNKDWRAARMYGLIMADAGNAPAAFHYARCLKHGLGGEINEARAANYFRQAVGVVPEANVELAELYLQGRGVKQDVTIARQLLDTPAVLKLAEARFILAMILDRAPVGTADPEMAVTHLRYAADRGHAQAMVSLGRRLMGKAEIATYSLDAYFWLRLARNKMTKETHGGIADLLDHNLRRLGAVVGEQKGELDKRAAAWEPTR